MTRKQPFVDVGLDVVEALVLDALTVDGQVVIFARGEIDIQGAPLLWDRIAAVIPDVRERLVIDLSETRFIDSTALTVLIKALKRLRNSGAELVLRAPNKSVRKLLNITGLDQLMTIESAPAELSSRVDHPADGR